MFKLKRKYSKALSLAMVMAMIFSLFVMPASAHDDHEDHDEAAIVYFIYKNSNGELVRSSFMPTASCGCSAPNNEDYTKDGSHNYKITDHTTPLVQYCTNCGWTFYYEGYAVGGCGSFCSYPKFPY